jgi:hypothetical protein
MVTASRAMSRGAIVSTSDRTQRDYCGIPTTMNGGIRSRIPTMTMANRLWILAPRVPRQQETGREQERYMEFGVFRCLVIGDRCLVKVGADRVSYSHVMFNK